MRLLYPEQREKEGMATCEKVRDEKLAHNLVIQGRKCIWRNHGVWDLDDNDRPILLKPRLVVYSVSSSSLSFW